jgi:hypothetical protein
VTRRYWLRVVIGLAICGAAVVAVDWGLYHLVRTGSCGTDENGFSVGPPCPPETAGHIMALIFGVFAGLIGIGIYAARGDGGRRARLGLGGVMWFLLWVTLPGAIALAAFGPAASDSTGAQAAAVIIALVFVPIGVIPIPFMLRSGGKQQQALELMTRGKRCPGRVLSVEDTNITINDNPRVKITVQAEPPGETPFTIEKTATVSRVAIPRAGDRCTVFYDPADREGKNGITFDNVAGVTVPPAASTTATASSGPDYTLPYARPGEEDDDPVEKIERLGELRDKGLISQAEFDDQKRRLLGEV